MDRRLVVASLGLILLLTGALLVPDLVGTPAQAQAQAQSQLSNVTVVRVRPDMLNEWIEFQTKRTIPGLRKAGVQRRDVWQSAIGPAFEYRMVTPGVKFADRATPGPIVRALGEEGAREYNAAYRKLISSQQTFVVRSRPDLTYDPNPNTLYRFMVLSFVHVAPGRVGDYASYLKNDILPLMKKGQAKRYAASQVAYGSDVNEFRTQLYYENWADFDADSPAVRAAGGQDALTKIQQKTAGIVTRADRGVYEYNENLSFRTTTTSTGR